ncbi:MAG TPA: LLM class F420-dependent oxidoreductase [Acidimicrobiales bacterium]|nr:LLM class F420-dependent oxidoreductase [Acidimicrobiales bacterium]
MDFDVWLPTANPFATPDYLAAVARECEARSVATLWVGEHAVSFEHYASSYPYAENGAMPLPPGSGLLEPWTTLAFLAACTSRVRLGTAMCLLPQRNPVYCAKEVATVDWLSGGRVDFGVGVGWLREESEAVGVPWPGRGARTDEYLEVLRTLWCEDPSSFHGRHYDLPACSMHPKPLQDPHPPVHVGGESTAALRRVARRGQGWHTFNRAPEDLPEVLGRLDELLAEEGRRRAEVRITVSPYFKPLDPDAVARYAEAGADAVSAMVFALSAEDVPAAFEALEPCLARAAAC